MKKEFNNVPLNENRTENNNHSSNKRSHKQSSLMANIACVCFALVSVVSLFFCFSAFMNGLNFLPSNTPSLVQNGNINNDLNNSDGNLDLLDANTYDPSYSPSYDAPQNVVYNPTTHTLTWDPVTPKGSEIVEYQILHRYGGYYSSYSQYQTTQTTYDMGTAAASREKGVIGVRVYINSTTYSSFTSVLYDTGNGKSSNVDRFLNTAKYLKDYIFYFEENWCDHGYDTRTETISRNNANGDPAADAENSYTIYHSDFYAYSEIEVYKDGTKVATLYLPRMMNDMATYEGEYTSTSSTTGEIDGEDDGTYESYDYTNYLQEAYITYYQYIDIQSVVNEYGSGSYQIRYKQCNYESDYTNGEKCGQESTIFSDLSTGQALEPSATPYDTPTNLTWATDNVTATWTGVSALEGVSPTYIVNLYYKSVNGTSYSLLSTVETPSTSYNCDSLMTKLGYYAFAIRATGSGGANSGLSAQSSEVVHGGYITVTFEGTGWTPTVASKQIYVPSVGADVTYGELPTATKSGKTFAGWYYYDTTVRHDITVFSTTKIAKYYDHELNAFGKDVACKVILNANGGTVDGATEFYYKADETFISNGSVYLSVTLKNLPTPTRDNFVFNGWYRDADSVQVDGHTPSKHSTYLVDENESVGLGLKDDNNGKTLTLYAMWVYDAPKNIYFNPETKTLSWDPVVPLGSETVTYKVFINGNIHYFHSSVYTEPFTTETSATLNDETFNKDTVFTVAAYYYTYYYTDNVNNTGRITEYHYGISADYYYQVGSETNYDQLKNITPEAPKYLGNYAFKWIDPADPNYYNSKYWSEYSEDDGATVDNHFYLLEPSIYKVKIFKDGVEVTTIVIGAIGAGGVYKEYNTDNGDGADGIVYYQLANILSSINDFGSGTYQIKVQACGTYGYYYNWNDENETTVNWYSNWSELSDSVNVVLPSVTISYNAEEHGGSFSSNGGYNSQETLWEGKSVDLDVTHRFGVKSGWVFIGWNTDKNATTALTYIRATDGMVLYAIYKKDITLSFYQVNATTAEVINVTLYNSETEKSVTTPTITASAGRTIVGWGTSTTATTSALASGAMVAVSESATYYAVYSYRATLTYDSNGGTGTSPARRNNVYITANGTASPTIKGFSVKLPGTTSTFYKTGYVLSGWGENINTSPDDCLLEGDTLVVTADTTLYAVWEAEQNEYTAIFDASDGSFSDGSKTKTVTGIPKQTTVKDGFSTAGVTINVPAGYKFKFWSTEKATLGDTNVPNNNSSKIVRDNVTYYAVYEACVYTITLNANGGTFGDTTTKSIKNVPYGSKLIDIVNANGISATRTDYIFSYWVASSTGEDSANDFVFNSTTKSNYTFYAYWATNTYTITLVANGGYFNGNTSLTTITISNATEGKTINNIIKQVTVARADGRSLKFWSETNNESTATNCGSKVLTSNITIYAIWYGEKMYAEITFDAGSYGTISGSTTVTVEYGKYVWEIVPTVTIRSGARATFSYWAKQGDLDRSVENSVIDDSLVTNGKLTLVAVYETTDVNISISFDDTMASGAKTISGVVKNAEIIVEADYANNRYIITAEDKSAVYVTAKDGYEVITGYFRRFYASSGLTINLQFNAKRTEVEIRLSAKLIYTYTGKQIVVTAELVGLKDEDVGKIFLKYATSDGLSDWAVGGDGIFRLTYKVKDINSNVTDEYIPLKFDSELGWYYEDNINGSIVKRMITNSALNVGSYIAIAYPATNEGDEELLTKYIFYGNPTCTFNVISQTLSAPTNVWWDETAPGMARWDEVTPVDANNPVKYTVRLYNRSGLITEITNVTNNYHNFANAIYEYKEGNYYYFTVTSTADSENISNSAESNVSKNLYTIKIIVQPENNDNISSVSIGNTSGIANATKLLIAGESGIEISAAMASGKTFKRWEISSDYVILTNANSSTTTIMLDPAVLLNSYEITITATANKTATIGERITVYLNTNGGTLAGQQSLHIAINSANGTTYVGLTNPTKAGYEFKGWFTSADFATSTKVAEGDKVTILADHTLYAKWEAKEIVIVIVGTGKGSTLITDGMGKFTASGGVGQNKITGSGTTQLTITLKYGDTIQYSGNKITIISGISGSNVTITITIAANAVAGYNTTIPTGGGCEYLNKSLSSTSTSITDGGNIWVNFERTALSYTVSFNANTSGSQPSTFDSIQVTFGQPYGSLPSVTKTGYFFKGWYTDAGSTGTKVVPTTLVQTAGNHTLYAHWEEVSYCTVTAHLNLDNDNGKFIEKGGWTISSDGKTATCRIEINEDTSLNQNYGLPGLSFSSINFIGWFVNSADSEIEAGSYLITTGTTSVTIYAKWSTKYTVTIVVGENGTITSNNLNGWTKVTDPLSVYQEFSIGSTVSLPTYFEKNVDGKYYQIKGFYDKPEGSDGATQYSNGFTPTADTTLYIWWEELGFVAFFYNDLDDAIYRFTQWLNDSKETMYKSSADFANNRLAALTHIFSLPSGTYGSQDHAANVLHYKFPGGTFSGYGYYRNHYSLVGWEVYKFSLSGSTLNNTYMERVQDSFTLNENHSKYNGCVFVPVFQAIYITVTCDLTTMGGSYTTSVYPGGTPSAPYGYKGFLGWFTSATGGNQVTSITSPCTVYAHWSENAGPNDGGTSTTVKITLDAGTGSCALTSVTSKNGKYPNLPNATPSNSTDKFLGWFTAASSGNQVTSGSTLSTNTDHTIYAHYGDASTMYTVTAQSMCGSTFRQTNGWSGSDTVVTKQFSAGAVLDTPRYNSPSTAKGWSLSSSGITAIPSNVSSNITIYLIYKQCTITVIPPRDDGWQLVSANGYTQRDGSYKKTVAPGSPIGTLPEFTDSTAAGRSCTWNKSVNTIVTSDIIVSANVVDPSTQMAYKIYSVERKTWAGGDVRTFGATQSFASKGATVTVQAPVHDGYKVIGYKIGTNGTAVESSSTSISCKFDGTHNRVTFYYQRLGYTVTVYAGNYVTSVTLGTSTATTGNYVTGSYSYFDSVAVFAKFDTSLYKFKGWAKDSTSGTIVSTSANYGFSVKENTTLYAVAELMPTATVKIAFSSNGRATPATIVGLKQGQVITLTEANVMIDGIVKSSLSVDSGYKITGFTINGLSATTYTVKQSDLGGTITIVVNVEQNDMRTIIYNYKTSINGAYVSVEMQVNINVTVGAGFTGGGISGYDIQWYTDAAFTNNVTNQKVGTLANRQNVYAKYSGGAVQVTLQVLEKASANELGSPVDLNITKGSALTLSGNSYATGDGQNGTLTVPNGYKIVGWTTDEGAITGSNILRIGSVTSYMTYYLLVEPAGQETCTLTIQLSADGNIEKTEVYEIQKGVYITLGRDGMYTINGQTYNLQLENSVYVFSYWSESYGGIAINQDTTITGYFKADDTNYKIDYVISNGGITVQYATTTTSYRVSNTDQLIHVYLSSYPQNAIGNMFDGFTAVTAEGVNLAVEAYDLGDQPTVYVIKIPAYCKGNITVTPRVKPINNRSIKYLGIEDSVTNGTLIENYTPSSTIATTIDVPTFKKGGYELVGWTVTSPSSGVTITFNGNTRTAIITINAGANSDITVTAIWEKGDIGVPRNLKWNRGVAMWTEPESKPASKLITYIVTLYNSTTVSQIDVLETNDLQADFTGKLRSSGLGTYYFTVQATVDDGIAKSSVTTSGNTYVSLIVVAKGTPTAKQLADNEDWSADLVNVCINNEGAQIYYYYNVIAGEQYSIDCIIKDNSPFKFDRWEKSGGGNATLREKNYSNILTVENGSNEITYTAYLTAGDVEVELITLKQKLSDDKTTVTNQYIQEGTASIPAKLTNNTIGTLSIPQVLEDGGFILDKIEITSTINGNRIISGDSLATTAFALRTGDKVTAYYKRKQVTCTILYYRNDSTAEQRYVFGAGTEKVTLGYYGTIFNVNNFFATNFNGNIGDGKLIPSNYYKFFELEGGGIYNTNNGQWEIGNENGTLKTNLSYIMITDMFMGTNGEYNNNTNNGYTFGTRKIYISTKSQEVKLSYLLLNGDGSSWFNANQDPVNVGYVPIGLDNSNKEKIYVSKVVVGTTEYSGVDWANTTATIQVNSPIKIYYERARYNIIIVFPNSPKMYDATANGWDNVLSYGKDGTLGYTDDGYWGSTEVISSWGKVASNLEELFAGGLQAKIVLQNKNNTNTLSINGNNVTIGTISRNINPNGPKLGTNSVDYGTCAINGNNKTLQYTVGTNDVIIYLTKKTSSLKMDYNFPDGSNGSISASMADGALAGKLGAGKVVRTLNTSDLLIWTDSDGITTNTNTFIMGYRFVSWSLSANGDVKFATPKAAIEYFTKNNTPVENWTVYAQWETILPYDSTERAFVLNTVSDQTGYPMIYMNTLLSYNAQFTTTDNQTINFNSANAKFIFATGGVDQIDLNNTYSYLTLNGDKLNIKTQNYVPEQFSAFSGTIQSKLAVTIILRHGTPLFILCNGTIEGAGSTKAITLVDNSSSYAVIPIETAYGGTFRYLIRDTNGGNTDICAGLIGEVEECTIEYCAMLMSINYTGDMGYTGGIVGYAKNSEINYCSMNGGSIVGSDNVGGIVGKAEGGSIKNCSNENEIKSTGSRVGGIVGTSSATIGNCYSSCTITIEGGTGQYVGGIVGYNQGLVYSSEFHGSINASGALVDYVGGIAGYSTCFLQSVKYTSSTNASISARDYVGGIVGKTTSNITSPETSGVVIYGRNYVGGIVGETVNKYPLYGGTANNDVYGAGYVGGAAGKAAYGVENVNVTGKIGDTIAYAGDADVVNAYIGGIAGYTEKSITNCTITITNGVIEVIGKDYVGGVVGYAKQSVIGCINETPSGSISGRNHIGGIAGYANNISGKSVINNLSITGVSFVGGIAGEAAGEISGATNNGEISGVANVGGIAGMADYVKNSYNHGQISINGASTSSLTNEYFGGIVGGKHGANATVEGSTNYKPVSASSANYVGGIAGAGNVYSSTNTERVLGKDYTGGIVGMGTVSSSSLEFKGGTTQSAAMVIGYRNVGGIVGYYDGGDGFNSIISDLSDDGSCYIAVGYNYVGAFIGFDSTNIYAYRDSGITALCESIGIPIYGKVASADYNDTNGLVGNNSSEWATTQVYIKGNSGIEVFVSKEAKI